MGYSISGLVIFSDMDGTLLSGKDYSLDVSWQAVERLKAASVPLVLVSSKTRAEMEYYRAAMGNGDPFVSENGGAVCIPKGYFPFEVGPAVDRGGYHCIELACPHRMLEEALGRVESALGITLCTFSRMSIDEVAAVCGFSLEMAALAKLREYDEPFLPPDDPRMEERVTEQIEALGFQWTHGGKFYHIMKGSDKGRACTLLRGLYGRAMASPLFVAIGDSLNDLPMFRVADRAYLVMRPDGTPDPRVNLPSMVLVPPVGPEGFSWVIDTILQKR